MSNKPAQLILVLITVAAVSFAVYTYVATPQQAAAPTPMVSASATTTPLATPVVDESPLVEPSVSPDRGFTDRQPLSVPNQTATVAQGSSLFTIAQEYELSVQALAKLNSIADPNTVKAGQTVIIPDNVTTDTYTVLFVTNPKRLEREKKNLENSTSIYIDPITSAQSDIKGIYNIAADLPYVKSNETETGVTLTSSDADKIVIVTMAKNSSGLWIMKKLTIKITKAAT